MVDREPRNVDYALGRIEAQLGTITQTLSEDRMASASYRTEVRKQLADTSEKVGRVSGDLHAAKEDIAEMKPKVVSLEQRALMSKGAAQLAVLLGKFAHIVSAAIGALVAILFERWLHR
jgi:hypothetical protein